MPATTLTAVATTALLKKVIDDLYLIAKDKAVALWGQTRADVREQAVAKALTAVTKVKTLWNIDNEVSLYDFYYPSIIEFSPSNRKKINSTSDLGTSGPIVVQGTAGQGKSIFLRYLCGQELTPTTSSDRVPIFVELRRISGDTGLIELILQALARYKLPHTPTALQHFSDSGKFVLLLDAFDEVDPSLSSRTLAEIENLSSLYWETLQIIVTSRPDSEIQKSANFRVVKLAPLSQTDHSPFLRRICSSREQAQSLEKVLRASSSDVRGLLTTPLMMTLLVILYKSLQTVPDTVPRFYEELFDVLFYRHDHSKPGFKRKRFTQLDDESVKKLFSGLCFFYRLYGMGVMTTSDFTQCCEQASLASDISVDPRALKNELIKTICLIQEEGFEISFIHKSVAQYYAASFVSKSSDDFADNFYKLCADNSSWALELKFLSQIDSFRFNKLYELPLLKRAASSFQIALDHDQEHFSTNVANFMRENVSLVIERSNDDVDAPYDYYGWSNAGSSDEAWKEFSYTFIHHVTDRLGERGTLVHTDFDSENRTPSFVRLKTFDIDAEPYYDQAACSVIQALQARHKKAVGIIETEERKTNMLSAFILKKKE